MPGKYFPILAACIFLLGCAPGYTGADVEEGLKEDASQIGAQFEKDVKNTEKLGEDVGDDVVAMARGEDTTDRHELSGSNSPQNQAEHERQMAALCGTTQANIHKLRQQGYSWNAIAKKYGLDTSPASQPVWLIWQ